MRHVYKPPASKSNPLIVLGGAGLMTLSVFLVLPLTQMISSGVQKQYDLSQIDTSVLQPPPPVTNLEIPPPPDPIEEPRPPELSEMPRQLSLGELDLDLSVGTGGVFAGGVGIVEDAMPDQVAIFNLSDLDQRPQPLAQVAPRHPPELLKAKIQGKVVLLFILDENGRITDPRIESSSRPEFEAPAMKALARWRFKPGTRDGKAVKTYVRQQILFRINQ